MTTSGASSPDYRTRTAKAMSLGGVTAALAVVKDWLANHPDSAEAWYAQGRLWRQSGELVLAETSYRRALELDQSQAAPWVSLGIVLRDRGDVVGAIGAYRNALSLHPEHPEAHINLANALLSIGEHDQALLLARNVTRFAPKLPAAHNVLAAALLATGEYHAAAQSARQALSLRGDYPEALVMHARALSVGGGRPDWPAASQNFRRAVTLKPDYFDAWVRLAMAAIALELWPEAAMASERAIQLQPERVEGYCQNVVQFWRQGQMTAALDALRAGLTQLPEDIELLNLQAGILSDLGQHQEALTVVCRAVALAPDRVSSHANQATLLRRAGLYAEAREALDRALVLAPEEADLRLARAFLLLAGGEWNLGWQEYEYRLKSRELLLQPTTALRPLEFWRGESLRGRRLLLLAEQGFGDVLQFIRYAPHLVALGARVTVQVSHHLMRVIATAPGVEHVVDDRSVVVDADLQCHLLSLPYLLGTRLDTIPVPIPYLRVDNELAVRWAERLGPPVGLRVGLVWAGSPSHGMDRQRSLSLGQLSALAEVPGVDWISLQLGPKADQLDLFPHWPVRRVTAHIQDFADTAALLPHLDLLISVDTSIVHLAGALGHEVWMLTYQPADWRWFNEGSDSPWYPGSLRLFRQSGFGDWDSAIAELVVALRQRVIRTCTQKAEPALRDFSEG